MKPNKGEFWIVESHGKVTVGRCYSAGAIAGIWQIIGKGDLINSTAQPDFRAVRKIDIAALIDGDPITVTSLSRLLLGVIVEAGGSVRISRSTQISIRPGEWQTSIRNDAQDGAIVVEALKGEKQ